ncbi:UDP-N-acetylmuramoyl-L-alanine--D-glutamate ligase [Nitrincola sp. A-D6]|uniref:UDP-N-acetylmuramoyl-L-alanine--D-glutamate ligase n=1 Tax=Nitrincola sp. A-D6 TaxID=1545442 RepID=UPI000B0939F1
MIATDTLRIIIGLGQTGYACARYMAAKGWPFVVVDTRDEPPLAADFYNEFPQIKLYTGELDPVLLASAKELILSPGVAKSSPAIQYAMQHDSRVIGDIDLFCREVSAPIVAITGSNAKSTVTTLVGDMARAAGINVAVGGNIGTPVLELLNQPAADLYVLELSSFQLETTHELKALAATVLNISPDHLDRYPDMQSYYLAKHRIYRGCRHCIVNRDDPLTAPLMAQGMKQISFGLSAPDLGQYGVALEADQSWLFQGLQPLMPVADLKVKGEHNVANVLAALSLGGAAGLPLDAMLRAVKQFTGLRHRCQWVAEKQGVGYINDSKGTNVGATLAAVQGLGAMLDDAQKLVIILGGVGKEQSFTELKAPLARYARQVLLIGRDADLIATDLQGLPLQRAESLEQAVALAADLAQPGDQVLLSPACASFDMFRGYEARGDRFIEIVESLL